MRPISVTPIIAAALIVGACSGYDTDDANAPGAGTGGAEKAAEAGEAAARALIATGTTPLGEVLTTADGLTLYGRPEDGSGAPSCDGACAETWPPLLVDGPELPDGLDSRRFGVARRPDGSHQLTAGGRPLYRHSGDAAPGDVHGQGSGGVWYAVTPDGDLAGGGPAGPAPETEPSPSTVGEPEAPTGGEGGYSY